jgi:hypothetical protein
MTQTTTYGAGVTIDPHCIECGGDHPDVGQAGEGWVITDSDPVLPNADGSPRHPPQMTVRPCSHCRPGQHRRWKIGHFPCPQRKMCNECKRLSGLRELGDEEHLPKQDERYESEPAEVVIQGEFDV